MAISACVRSAKKRRKDDLFCSRRSRRAKTGLVEIGASLRAAQLRLGRRHVAPERYDARGRRFHRRLVAHPRVLRQRGEVGLAARRRPRLGCEDAETRAQLLHRAGEVHAGRPVAGDGAGSPRRRRHARRRKRHAAVRFEAADRLEQADDAFLDEIVDVVAARGVVPGDPADETEMHGHERPYRVGVVAVTDRGDEPGVAFLFLLGSGGAAGFRRWPVPPLIDCPSRPPPLSTERTRAAGTAAEGNSWAGTAGAGTSARTARGSGSVPAPASPRTSPARSASCGCRSTPADAGRRHRPSRSPTSCRARGRPSWIPCRTQAAGSSCLSPCRRSAGTRPSDARAACSNRPGLWSRHRWRRCRRHLSATARSTDRCGSRSRPRGSPERSVFAWRMSPLSQRFGRRRTRRSPAAPPLRLRLLADVSCVVDRVRRRHLRHVAALRVAARRHRRDNAGRPCRGCVTVEALPPLALLAGPFDCQDRFCSTPRHRRTGSLVRPLSPVPQVLRDADRHVTLHRERSCFASTGRRVLRGRVQFDVSCDCVTSPPCASPLSQRRRLRHRWRRLLRDAPLRLLVRSSSMRRSVFRPLASPRFVFDCVTLPGESHVAATQMDRHVFMGVFWLGPSTRQQASCVAQFEYDSPPATASCRRPACCRWLYRPASCNAAVLGGCVTGSRRRRRSRLALAVRLPCAVGVRRRGVARRVAFRCVTAVKVCATPSRPGSGHCGRHADGQRETRDRQPIEHCLPPLSLSRPGRTPGSREAVRRDPGSSSGKTSWCWPDALRKRTQAEEGMANAGWNCTGRGRRRGEGSVPAAAAARCHATPSTARSPPTKTVPEPAAPVRTRTLADARASPRSRGRSARGRARSRARSGAPGAGEGCGRRRRSRPGGRDGVICGSRSALMTVRVRRRGCLPRALVPAGAGGSRRPVAVGRSGRRNRAFREHRRGAARPLTTWSARSGAGSACSAHLAFDLSPPARASARAERTPCDCIARVRDDALPRRWPPRREGQRHPRRRGRPVQPPAPRRPGRPGRGSAAVWTTAVAVRWLYQRPATRCLGHLADDWGRRLAPAAGRPRAPRRRPRPARPAQPPASPVRLQRDQRRPR